MHVLDYVLENNFSHLYTCVYFVHIHEVLFSKISPDITNSIFGFELIAFWKRALHVLQGFTGCHIWSE